MTKSKPLISFNYNNLKNYDESSDNIIGAVLDTISVVSKLHDDDNRLCEITEKYIDLAIETLELSESYNASINLFFQQNDFNKWIENIEQDYLVEDCYSVLEEIYSKNSNILELEYDFLAVVPTSKELIKDHSTPWNLYISIFVAY